MDKRKKLKRQVSNDGGMTWQDMIPYEYIAGELIQRDSPDCNNIEWRTVSGYICEENTTEMTQWVADTGYVCVGFDKYNKEKEQISYNSGISWADTGNTKAGSTLIEANSEDCGYIPPHDYSRDYLTTEALNSGNMKLTNQYQSGIQYYSKNGGSWTSYTQGSDISVVAGDVIRWKGTVANNGRVGQFVCTYNYKAYGNTLSLLKGDNFIGVTDISGYENAVLMGLFVNQTTLMDVSNLILSATTLGNLCYFDMFRGCTSLTSVPALPATTLSSGCYRDMFEGCTSLTSVPALPATTLKNGCYDDMFSGCTSLTSVPSDLLPATTLNPYCYYSMFEGCTSLTNAPVLPATTLVNYCYYRIFYGCTSLNSVTCRATDISASNATTNWLSGVSSTGTFTKAAGVSWSSGQSGIPTGWTVVDAT